MDIISVFTTIIITSILFSIYSYYLSSIEY